MKLELTIKVDYLPKWGVFEGIRELVQNGRDAQVEFGAPLQVLLLIEKDGVGTLVIENDGTTLEHEALLLGHTSKTGRGDCIGKFGEGLKLGVLALVRAGHAVKIRSGDEVWVPAIERSERFKANVLTFDVQKGRANKNRVRVEVANIADADWKEMKKCFLFLGDPGDLVRGKAGALLLDPEKKGRIFVKGIFVANEPKLAYGYDFAEADLDRDRRMVASWELPSLCRQVWQETLAQRPGLVAPFYGLLVEQTPDASGVATWNADKFPAKELALCFAAEHGEGSVPVKDLAESRDLAHLGQVGVVVNEGLGAVLAKVLGTASQIKERLHNEVTASHGWHELDQAESVCLEQTIELVERVRKVSLGDIDLVTFRSSALQGMYKDGRILLAKKLLGDRNLTLKVLVHEVAHRYGGDGEKDHVAEIEEIWSEIVRRLR